jgi:hypothetical protein
MHPTPQGVTLDFEQYDKLKDVDSVAGTKKHVKHLATSGNRIHKKYIEYTSP